MKGLSDSLKLLGTRLRSGTLWLWVTCSKKSEKDKRKYHYLSKCVKNGEFRSRIGGKLKIQKHDWYLPRYHWEGDMMWYDEVWRGSCSSIISARMSSIYWESRCCSIILLIICVCYLCIENYRFFIVLYIMRMKYSQLANTHTSPHLDTSTGTKTQTYTHTHGHSNMDR